LSLLVYESDLNPINHDGSRNAACDLPSLAIKQAKEVGVLGHLAARLAAAVRPPHRICGYTLEASYHGTILADWEEKAVREDRGGVAFVVACAINPASSEFAALFKIQARSMKN
jgi:hypothetical protein